MKRFLLLLFLLIGVQGQAGSITVGSFVKTVASAGTEEALSSSLEGVAMLTCKAESDNTGVVYIGGNPVTSATGLELAAGNAVTLGGVQKNGTTQNDIEPKKIYIDVATNGDGVECMWIRHQ